jgi:hypothetical protein
MFGKQHANFAGAAFSPRLVVLINLGSEGEK